MYRPNRRTSHRFDPEVVIVLVFFALVVALLVFGVVSATHTEEHTGCTVTDKDRTTNRDGDSEARVYTEQCGVFKVGDSLLSWTWHSADTYGDIEVGQTYDFTTRGYRVPFFSRFPNIVEVSTGE